jgi:hypothetical protein
LIEQVGFGEQKVLDVGTGYGMHGGLLRRLRP